jgi:hypothetical protein
MPTWAMVSEGLVCLDLDSGQLWRKRYCEEMP